MSANAHPQENTAPKWTPFFDTDCSYTRCPPGYVFDLKRGDGFIKHALTVINDGLVSRNDYVNRPIVSAPISIPGGPPIFIANLAGAKYAVERWPQPGAVLNLCHAIGRELDHPCVDGSLAVADQPIDVEAELHTGWFTKTAARIDALRESNDWVVVNCMGGINRSVAAVINYLIVRENMNYESAKRLVKLSKYVSAKRLNFKNRYQSFDPASKTFDKFSWPALCGGASSVFEAELKKQSREQLQNQRGVKRQLE